MLSTRNSPHLQKHIQTGSGKLKKTQVNGIKKKAEEAIISNKIDIKMK
jgi:hypothetical protein